MIPTPEVVAISPKNMVDCRTFSDRTTALTLVPKGGRIAEVGVAYGDFSKVLMSILEPSCFYALDLFSIKPGEPEFWECDTLRKSKLNHYEFYANKFKEEISGGKLVMRQGVSWDLLYSFEDAFFDYIYLDAGHDYDSVYKDIQAAQSKVKNGGYIQFNDYTLWSMFQETQYGVVQAVNNFVNSGNHQIRAYCVTQYGYDDILVQIIR